MLISAFLESNGINVLKLQDVSIYFLVFGF